MHSTGATGQKGHDSQTLTTGVNPPCPRASVDNPTLGYMIREIEDFTAEFRQRMRRNPTFTMGKYIYGIILLRGLIIYDQQEQLRRRANHYSAWFHMVWQACRFFWSWLHQNHLMLVGIFIGVALIVPTQISPSEYFRQQAERLLVVGITASYWIYRQLFELALTGTERSQHIWARMQVYRVLMVTGTQDAQS